MTTTTTIADLNEATRAALAERERQKLAAEEAEAEAARTDQARRNSILLAQSNARKALLTRLIDEIIQEALQHLRTEIVIGDASLRFNERKRRLGLLWRYTATLDKRHACWAIGHTDRKNKLYLSSGGVIAVVLPQSDYDYKYNLTQAGVWEYDMNDDLLRLCAVLRGLRGRFKEITLRVLSHATSDPGLDDTLCSRAFGLSREQLVTELLHPIADEPLQIEPPRNKKGPKKRKGRKKRGS